VNFVKPLIVILILLIVQLQYRLWLGDGSRQQVQEYQQQLDILSIQVKEKQQRNQALLAEVNDLKDFIFSKNGTGEAIEERARYELGMIKDNETFFQVIE
jgi:cell division protein FtsB